MVRSSHGVAAEEMFCGAATVRGTTLACAHAVRERSNATNCIVLEGMVGGVGGKIEAAKTWACRPNFPGSQGGLERWICRLQ